MCRYIDKFNTTFMNRPAFPVWTSGGAFISVGVSLHLELLALAEDAKGRDSLISS